jgi:PAS domain S-box-containing protein
MGIPVVYLTAHADEATLERARRTAPFGYLLKPFQERELQLTIEMALHKHRLDRQVRESEERYRTLFDRVPIGLFRCRPDGTLLMVNPALVKTLRYPDANSLLATNLTELFPTGERPSWPARTHDSSVSTECRARMVCYGGSTIWIQAILREVSEDGELAYYEGSVEDITGRKEAEDEIHQHAAQLEALNEVIAAAIAAQDLEGLLETALHQVLQVLDLENGAVWVGEATLTTGLPLSVARSLARQRSPRGTDVPGVMAIEDWQAGELVGSMGETAELVASDGIRAFLTAPVIADGRVVGGVALVGDQPRTWSSHQLTFVEAVGRQLGTAAERLRLLATIREQVLRLHQIIHTVPGGVVLLDSRRYIVLANPTAREHLANLTDAEVGDVIDSLGGVRIDTFLQRPGGHRHELEVDARQYEIVAQGIQTSEGHDGWVLLTSDVTEERNLQRRIEQRDRLAAVGQLAAGIAHDFSNIMAVVLLYAQMALREPKTPNKTRERLEVIGQQARRATDLIQQILDFSRNSLLERQRVDLVPFLKETVKLLERTLPSDIVVDFNYGVGDHVVSADPTRIQQLVMNLALNARDAMPEGGNLEVSVERITVKLDGVPPVPELTPGDWIRLSVADTGEGIAPDVVTRIFEPFFTTKAPGHGSGLGLAQVYGIVEQHDGVIDLVTEQGQGTTFFIYLAALPLQCPTEHRACGEAQVALGQGETVLLVEDSPATRGALAESLTQLNYRVLEAGDGQEALAVVRERGSNIDLVLTDVVMPKMGGLPLLEALRGGEWEGPTILLSGHPLEKSIQDRLIWDGVVCLEKPAELAELAAVLSQLLHTEPATAFAVSLL